MVPGHVGGGVEEVLFGALAVQADGDEVSAVLLHELLEVVVAERLVLLQVRGLEHAIYQLVHLSDWENFIGFPI